MERLGDHNMPAGLYADWNDCLRLGKRGESTFVAFQLYYAMSMMRKLAEKRGDAAYVTYLDQVQAELGKSLSKCWDEDRFIRGIREDGVVVGAKKDPGSFYVAESAELERDFRICFRGAGKDCNAVCCRNFGYTIWCQTAGSAV